MLARGVAGIGGASFLADVGHEIPTALLPNLLTSTLGAPAPAFLAAGLAIGCVETAEQSASTPPSPPDLRGSAFGLLATVQSLGNLAASAIAGMLWTALSPAVAFGYLTAWMALALAALLVNHRT